MMLYTCLTWVPYLIRVKTIAELYSPMILNANQELLIRIFVFTGILLIMLAWERMAPRREPGPGSRQRRGNNLLLVLCNSIMVRFLLPLTTVGVAEVAIYMDWGLLNKYPIDPPLDVVISLIVFDLVLYAQHVLLHKIPPLWRLHRAHHIDQDLDATTGLRLHPFEVALSTFVRLLVVLLLGAPALAVMIFEVMLNASSMFNHGNVSIPSLADRWLRWFIVTPDMHRVHHSVYRDERDSNYGFNLSCWDRLFGTYRAQPRDGHSQMRIGVSEFSGKITVNLMWLLVNPFIKPEETGEQLEKSL